ncbi:MAG: methylenetetrahydrofolate reductase [NAD(P)H] [Candidatus Margulisbacteria bacterium]|nr:methylenetetrahydrofolate reductase [NAD(P)H] [Candidatus Margulisiibacteriota bacterium]
MKLGSLYQKGKLIYSYEVFPPKTDEGVDKLINELKKLEKFKPSFISVTYGAGGSTQGRSIKLIKLIKDKIKSTPVPHFTCIGSDKESILSFTKVIEDLGLHNILALRGDIPKDTTNYHPKNNVFHYADELVAFIKEKTSLHIAVAGYPEKHPEANTLEEDLEHLKQKVDAGAEVVITQLFYENKRYFEFIEKAKKIGIKIPIIPGILPTTSKKQLDKILELCKGTVHVPKELQESFDKYKDQPEKAKNIGIDFAVKQVKELIKANVLGIHFYTLNQAEAVGKVIEALPLPPNKKSS